MNSKWNSFEQNADKKAVVEARPCIRHNVYLVLNFINESKFFVASTRTEYNRPSAGFKSGDLYSGWLESEVVKNICLNRTKGPVTLIVPDPPEALKDCIENYVVSDTSACLALCDHHQKQAQVSVGPEIFFCEKAKKRLR